MALVSFSPKLFAPKRHGLREYGAVAAAYVEGFDAKWGARRGAPGRIPARDRQSLNDLAGGFGIIRAMRVMPFGPALVLVLVAATLLPMAPLLFLEFPVDELLAMAARLIVGG